jgi:DNA invertase Pin-like site-specific DNA recombinase
MEKAFGYLRVSGLGQVSGDGFPRQRAAITAYAKANGFKIEAWFEEKAITGDSEWESRPAWLKMIESLNGCRTIIVERLDRLARQMGIQEYVLRDLRRRNIQLITALGEETGDDDPVRVAMRQMLGVFAQYDKAMIVKKLKAARARMKLATGRCEGRKAYGRDAGETAILARMTALRAGGETFQGIASRLNSEGVLTRYGRQWSPQTVCQILAR